MRHSRYATTVAVESDLSIGIFNIIKGFVGGQLVGFIESFSDESFQRAEERLSHYIIPTVVALVYVRWQVVGLAELFIVVTGIQPLSVPYDQGDFIHL